MNAGVAQHEFRKSAVPCAVRRIELPYYIRSREKVEFGGNTLAQPFLRLE